MLYCEEILKKGFPLCLFPEGKRSIDGKVDKPKPGFSRLVKVCGVPVVPVHIRGVKYVLSRLNPGFKLCKAELEVLPPLEATDDEARIKKEWLGLMRERDALV